MIKRLHLILSLPPQILVQKLLVRYWPLFASLGILWIAIAVFFLQSLAGTQGHIIYALDDAYIHISIAKNLAQYGIWGITPHEYSSASSSILWTLLLSGIYYITGIHEITPLILNIIFASIAIAVAYFSLKNIGRQYNLYIFFLLVAIIWFTPLIPLIFSGMEQNLQITLTLSFTYVVAQYLATPTKSKQFLKRLYIITPLFALIRYESLFVIAPVLLLLMLHQRFSAAFCISILSFFPLCIFGIYSIVKGGYFLPTSVIVKTVTISDSQETYWLFFKRFFLKIQEAVKFLSRTPDLWSILFTLYIAFYFLSSQKKYKKVKCDRIFSMITMMTIFLHLCFIHLDHFFRYEAYLVVLSLVAIGRIIIPLVPPIEFFFQNIKKNLFISLPCLFILLFCLLSSPLFVRGINGTKITPRATQNIYEQQYQMGLFVRRFYPSQAIAANDIGAISYLGNSRILDLWGLANREVADLIIYQKANKETIEKLARERDVKISILYERVFGYLIPDRWVKVGEWRIKNNVVAASDTVAFYAVNEREKKKLIQNLNTFSPELPQDVEEIGEYVEYSQRL